MIDNEYTDAHRLFLQASLSERFFTEAKAIEIYRKAYEATAIQDQETFTEFMTTLNTKLNSIELEFRKSHNEEDGTAVWALVNTNGDEIAQMATDYSPIEISFFRRLIELIITADDESFSVSSITALKEVVKLKTSITKSNGEILLQRFIDDKWLSISSGGRYSLSLRSILELQHYLKKEFEDYISECILCYDIVTKGQRCQVAQSWDSSNVFGDSDSINNRSRTRRSTTTRRSQRSVVDEADDDQMDQDDD
ncbi:hypothetical protein RCL_jg8844.t1 [Rhizophagus clarus]|uniref:Non-structural maintenance of chromosomes element 1 homolog n=1 Tax=Rhizophagus clarus TaxID=94130 RepID=A0A8H3QFQ8_9GLOM|nr:hypothetical protein RCL_jg8844.t1 [Rhizophagus clarus]